MSKIDVHHHIYAPAYIEGKTSLTTLVLVDLALTESTALNASGGDPSGWYVPDWTIELDRAACKRIGVKTAILSPTAPFPDNFSDSQEQASFARKLNEFSAKIRDSDPEHYGFFAAVPSPRHVKFCIAELGYAFGAQPASGVMSRR